jgi:hypothetical protein
MGLHRSHDTSHENTTQNKERYIPQHHTIPLSDRPARTTLTGRAQGFRDRYHEIGLLERMTTGIILDRGYSQSIAEKASRSRLRRLPLWLVV